MMCNSYLCQQRQHHSRLLLEEKGIMYVFIYHKLQAEARVTIQEIKIWILSLFTNMLNFF